MDRQLSTMGTYTYVAHITKKNIFINLNIVFDKYVYQYGSIFA